MISSVTHIPGRLPIEPTKFPFPDYIVATHPPSAIDLDEFFTEEQVRGRVHLLVPPPSCHSNHTVQIFTGTSDLRICCRENREQNTGRLAIYLCSTGALANRRRSASNSVHMLR